MLYHFSERTFNLSSTACLLFAGLSLMFIYKKYIYIITKVKFRLSLDTSE